MQVINSVGVLPSVDNTTMKLLLYPINKRINKRGLVPIYLRITVSGKRTEISTGVMVKPEHWNQSLQLITGGPCRNEQNAIIHKLMNKALELGHDNIKEIKNKNKHRNKPTLCIIINDFYLHKEKEYKAGIITAETLKSIEIRTKTVLELLNCNIIKHKEPELLTQGEIQLIYTHFRNSYSHNYTLKILQVIKAAYEYGNRMKLITCAKKYTKITTLNLKIRKT